MSAIKFGVITVSDRCFYGGLENVAGMQLTNLIKEKFSGAQVEGIIVPDEIPEIQEALLLLAIDKCDVILTTGGTGFSPRDVTPEATKAVIEKEAPGLAYAMVAKSLKITDKAMLSRAVCGIYKKSLIINLPGSPKAAVECFGFIYTTFEHAVELLKDEKENVAKTHEKLTGKSDTYSQESIEQPNFTEGEFGKSINASTNSLNSTKTAVLPELSFTPSKVKLPSSGDRERESAYPMIEVDAATDIIIKNCCPTSEVETVPYEQSLNRILAEEIYATEPVPPFNASVKDGYAVKSTDSSTTRIIREVIAAGDEPSTRELQPGEAVRISTGAPVPPGADAVVQIEDTELIEKSSSGKEVSICIKKLPTPGQDIRPIGSDIAEGSAVLNIFDKITSSHIGVLATLGKTDVKVFKKPAIAILSTGNELKDPRETLQPGQIRDSNKSSLINLLKKYGFESQDDGIVKDDPDMVKYGLEKAFSKSNVVITTGGVSMGEFDILKQVLIEDFSATVHFGRVNMKPGKPTTFATLKYKGKSKLFFGLPGNPVSCNVTALLFIIPTLRYKERSKVYKFPVVSLKAPGLSNNDPKPDYHTVTVSMNASGELIGTSTEENKINRLLKSVLGANGLALVLKKKQTSSIFSIASFGMPSAYCTCSSLFSATNGKCSSCGRMRANSTTIKTIIFDEIVYKP